MGPPTGQCQRPHAVEFPGGGRVEDVGLQQMDPTADAQRAALMSGLKMAATIAPVGAVVGEWAGAAGGLGFVYGAFDPGARAGAAW